jgi:glyoxylase-like metal-dependent hydrolase (beta-lactamase superfamily II)
MKQLLISILSILTCLQSTAGQVIDSNAYFKTVKITDNIYLFEPANQLNDFVDGNCTAFVGKTGVLLADAMQKPYYAEEAIKALGKITALPVKYIFITHWHGDHNMALGVWKKKFPGLIVIAQTETDKGMQDNRREINEIKKGYPGFIQPSEQSLKDRKNFDGTPMTDYDFKRLTSTVAEMKKIVAHKEQYNFVPPDITFSDSLIIDFDGERLELFHTPEAHTKGDAMLWAPSKKILVTGDMIVNPIPYAFSAWHPGLIKNLEHIKEMNPLIIIPGHGPIEQDFTYIDRLITLLKDFEDAFNTAIAKFEKPTFPEMKKEITMEKYRQLFAGDDEVKNWAFTNFFLGPAIYNHLLKWREKKGIKPRGS